MILGEKMQKNIIVSCVMIATLLTACNNTSVDNTSTTNDQIELYHAFGNEKHLLVEGRTVNKSSESIVSENDSGYTNVWNALNLFQNDELKNKKVFLTIDKEKYETQSDNEGYFSFNTTLSKVHTMSYTHISLQIKNNKNSHNAQATILSSQKEMIGIISDIDDTVVVSDVPHKTELLLNTFWKNYKQREVIPTMVERFQKILAANPPTQPSRLFFISGSPKQLYSPIEKFLTYNHFPKHILILKQTQGKDKDSLSDQLAYKTKKIEALIALYPHMKWIMFGDSGEKDLETYEGIKEKYPDKIKAYYIRNVNSKEITRIE